MSAFVLTKDYTSDWNADKGVWVAKPNRVELHNLRVKMEAQEAREQTISIAAPVSAVKMEKRNVVDISEFNNETELKSEQFTDLDARYMGLQVVSPSNKMDMVDMSQIKELVTSEQDDSVKVEGLKNLDGANKLFVSNQKIIRRVIGSRSHSNKDFDIWTKKYFPNSEIVQAGSSFKFCLIAEGFADIYPRFGPTSEWDIAAGHIIVNEAGGEVRTFDNTDIKYNTKEDLLNPHFYAIGKFKI